MKMISFAYLSVFAFCVTFAAGIDEEQEIATTPLPSDEDVPAGRELTDTGYVIRYGDELYRYPGRIVPLIRRVQLRQQNETETNEIENDEESERRPLFYFTTYEPPESSRPHGLPTSRPYIEIRRKRDATDSEIPESSKIGKLRRKRTYCRKCGGGGYGGGGYGGGYYVPVTYAVYPVYVGGGGRGGGGGGGRGCYSCGGGYGGGGGGGGGGSFSYSSSSSQSSAGSYGWGKK